DDLVQVMVLPLPGYLTLEVLEPVVQTVQGGVNAAALRLSKLHVSKVQDGCYRCTQARAGDAPRELPCPSSLLCILDVGVRHGVLRLASERCPIRVQVLNVTVAGFGALRRLPRAHAYGVAGHFEHFRVKVETLEDLGPVRDRLVRSDVAE